jgi:hypothetical protein
VETMENSQKPLSEPEGFGYLRVLGYPGRRVKQRLLADVSLPSASTCTQQCFLAFTRIEELLTAVPTPSYLTEPPDADPHVRWCGRGAVIPSPYPN